MSKFDHLFLSYFTYFIRLLRPSPRPRGFTVFYQYAVLRGKGTSELVIFILNFAFVWGKHVYVSYWDTLLSWFKEIIKQIFKKREGAHVCFELKFKHTHTNTHTHTHTHTWIASKRIFLQINSIMDKTRTLPRGYFFYEDDFSCLWLLFASFRLFLELSVKYLHVFII